MKYDQLIRNGTLVDGTGTERHVADIGVKDGRIAAMGQLSPRDAREVVDADGLIVSPGFVDCHTHYDAQLFWDPLASPSSFHGVTTVIGGLCGFTIQPLDEQTAEYIVPMLSKVEDIPISALNAGVPFDWNSFAQYRSRLEGRLAINAGFATGHSTLRQLVMQDRAKGETATAADIEQMQALLRQSLTDGALGLSTSHSTTHNDHLGEPVPSRYADYDEFVALASVCRDFEGSQVEIQPGMEFDEEAARLMAGMSVASQRTVNWNAMFTKGMDEETLRLIERQLSMSDYARERGGNVVGLTLPVHGSAHIDLIRGCGVFDAIPGWEAFFRLSVAERVNALRDSEWRETLKKKALSPEAQSFAHVRVVTNGDRLLVESAATSDVRHYEGASLKEIAEQQGKTPLDVLFDLGVADGLGTLFTFRVIGDDAATYRKRLDLWRDDRLCVGGSDAGAHVETIDTFNYFTRLLARPVRELGVVSLEECIHHITQAPARLMGLRDRGELRTGAWADICIFDKDTVGSRAVETRTDFPGGASRLYAEADGMERVIVSGVTVLDRGRPTGKSPGQFLVRGRDTYTVGVDAWR